MTITITPDGKTVYVANYDSGTVTPISTATNTAGPADQGRPAGDRDRDHAGRQDRLRGQLAGRHGDADQHRHQQARPPIHVGHTAFTIAITR